MKVLIVGSGGREHTIIKALKKSPEITELYALPGNGGIAEAGDHQVIREVDGEGDKVLEADRDGKGDQHTVKGFISGDKPFFGGSRCCIRIHNDFGPLFFVTQRNCRNDIRQ